MRQVVPFLLHLVYYLSLPYILLNNLCTMLIQTFNFTESRM